MGWFEEAREFIRRLRIADTDVAALKLRAQAVAQGINDAWAQPAGTGFSMAVVSGTITGCNSLGAVGIDVVVYEHGTSVELGSATTDGTGGYMLAVAIQGTSATADVSIGQPASDPYQRLAPLAFTTTLSAGSNTISTSLSPQSGYQCLAHFAFPVAGTLTLVDPQQGSGSAVFGAAPSPGFPAWTCDYGAVNIPASSSCAGATGSRFVVSLVQSVVDIVWQYRPAGGFSGACPIAGSAIAGNVSEGPTPSVASQPTGTTLLDVSYPLASGDVNSKLFYGGGAVSVRFHE